MGIRIAMECNYIVENLCGTIKQNKKQQMVGTHKQQNKWSESHHDDAFIVVT